MSTMLFREASEPNEEVWGLPVEYAVFDDDEVADQLADGWSAHPHDICPPEVETPKRGPGRPRKNAEEA